MKEKPAEHEKFIDGIIQDALQSENEGCFPQACCLVHKGTVISRSRELCNNTNFLKYAELRILAENTAYIHDFGNECLFYSVFEPHYTTLALLADAGIKSFYFGVYREEHSASELIDKVVFIRKMLHYYSSGYMEAKILKLFGKHMLQ
ncbi:MAG: hypothetical protein JW874_15025 [Spirochaetales bacterium]|nr:hypothetical protein [Spirochaetales bacterium]